MKTKPEKCARAVVLGLLTLSLTACEDATEERRNNGATEEEHDDDD